MTIPSGAYNEPDPRQEQIEEAQTMIHVGQPEPIAVAVKPLVTEPTSTMPEFDEPPF